MPWEGGTALEWARGVVEPTDSPAWPTRMHWKWWNYLVYVELPSQGIHKSFWDCDISSNHDNLYLPQTSLYTTQYLGGIFRDKKLWALHLKTVNSFFTTLLFSKPKKTMEGPWRCSVPYMMCWDQAGQENTIKTWAPQRCATKMCLNNLHRAHTTGTGTQGLIIWDSTRTTTVRCDKGFASARI